MASTRDFSAVNEKVCSSRFEKTGEFVTLVSDWHQWPYACGASGFFQSAFTWSDYRRRPKPVERDHHLEHSGMTASEICHAWTQRVRKWTALGLFRSQFSGNPALMLHLVSAFPTANGPDAMLCKMEICTEPHPVFRAVLRFGLFTRNHQA
jgi:hypothetical protein